MTPTDHPIAGDDIHPIDIVQALATQHAWNFDRLADDQIAMVLEGQWRNYVLTLAWSPCDAVLRLVCSFDMAPPAERMPAIYQTINLANDRVWDGAFTFWDTQGQMVWRYGLVLAGDAIALPQQVDRMIANALTACERFYPSFQLVAWADKSPDAALKIAFGPACGTA